MTHPAVEHVLDAIETHWQAGPFDYLPMKRIDRDNSRLLEGDVRSHSEDLQSAILVGAAHVDRDTSPIGAEYDHDLETVVGVRLEGLHADEYGYVDGTADWPPDGPDDPVPWTAFRKDLQQAILRDRQYPDTGEDGISYTHLFLTNEAPQSADYGDYYRYDFDVVFDGFETLP